MDDATRMAFVYPLKTKSSAKLYECFLEFKNEFEQNRKKIKAVRTDGRKEYAEEVNAFLKRHGIKHKTMLAYTSEQNRVTERLNRTIVSNSSGYQPSKAALSKTSDYCHLFEEQKSNINAENQT